MNREKERNAYAKRLLEGEGKTRKDCSGLGTAGKGFFHQTLEGTGDDGKP